MSQPLPPGVYVPAVLFMNKDEDLDLPAIRSHVLRLAKGGVNGILVQGSNGEAQHLSHDERVLAIRTTRETLDDNGFSHVFVIAGTGAQTIRETKKLNEDAKMAGASHALILTPSTWAKKMTTETILRFHREVADASPIPTMVYNFPSVTAGIDLDSDIISELALHPNIVGTKLSCGNIGKLHRLASTCSPSSFSVFSGQAAVMLQGLMSGGAGAIAALPNILPKLHVKLYYLWQERKYEEAMELQAKLSHADWFLSKAGGIGVIKAIINSRFGYGEPFVRGPLPSGNPQKLVGVDIDRLDELIELEKQEGAIRWC